MAEKVERRLGRLELADYLHGLVPPRIQVIIIINRLYSAHFSR